MKKIVLACLGLLVVGLFLVGCTSDSVDVVDEEGNLVGEAFRLDGKYQLSKKQIECKQFDEIPANPITGYKFCTENGFDTCVDQSFYVAYEEAGETRDNLLSFPLGCEATKGGTMSGLTPYETLVDNAIEVFDLETSDNVFNAFVYYTCCKIK